MHRLAPILYALFFALPFAALYSGLALAPLLYAMAILTFLLCAPASLKVLTAARLKETRSFLMHPAALVCLVIAISGIATLGWSAAPKDTTKSVIAVVTLFLAGMTLIHTLPHIPGSIRQRFFTAFTSGYAIAALLLLLETYTPFGPASLITSMNGGDYELYREKSLNRGLSAMAVLLWPAMYHLIWRRQSRIAFILPPLLLASLLQLHSLAANVAVLAAIPVAAILAAWPHPKLTFAFRSSLVLGVAALPLILKLAFACPALGDIRNSLPESAAHRLHIWHFALSASDEKPLWGWGMKASRAIPGAEDPAPAGGVNLPLHPHNGAVQMVLELGMAGFAAIIIALYAWTRHWQALAYTENRFFLGASAAAMTAYVVIGVTAFGTWQSWWLAAAFFTAAMFESGRAQQMTLPWCRQP